MIFFEIVTIVFPVFLVMVLGNVLKRIGLIDQNFQDRSNRLVFLVFLPLLLFYKIGTSDFSVNFNPSLVYGCAIALTVCFALTYGYASLRRYPAAVRGVFSQGAFRGNWAIVGLAVVLNAHGADGLTRAGILMGFIVPLLNLLAVVALLLPHTEDGNHSWTYWAKQVFLNPLIAASLIGIGWSYYGLHIPVIADRTLNIVTGVTLPLALMAVGAGVSLENLKGDLVCAAVVTSIKNVLLPLGAAFLLYALGVRGIDLSVGVLMVGAPTAASSYIMTSQMKGDVDLAGSIIVLSTLLSALSFTIALYFLKMLVL